MNELNIAEIIAGGFVFAGLVLALIMIARGVAAEERDAWDRNPMRVRCEPPDEIGSLECDCISCSNVGWFLEDGWGWVACPNCNWEGDKPKPPDAAARERLTRDAGSE